MACGMKLFLSLVDGRCNQAVGDAADRGTLHGAPLEVAEYPPVVLESMLSLLSLLRKKSSCLAAFSMVSVWWVQAGYSLSFWLWHFFLSLVCIQCFSLKRIVCIFKIQQMFWIHILHFQRLCFFFGVVFFYSLIYVCFCSTLLCLCLSVHFCLLVRYHHQLSSERIVWSPLPTCILVLDTNKWWTHSFHNIF